MKCSAWMRRIRMERRVLCGFIAAMVGLGITTAATALPPESNTAVLRAVPAPGEVVIDGVLGDTEWDKTAEMLSYPVRRIRDKYSVRVHAMWDAEALYLGLAWNDPTPMMNKVDSEGAPFDGWQADALQLRLVTDYSQIHTTMWYSSKKDQTVATFSYEGPLNRDNMALYRADGTVLDDPSGFRQAFRVNPDNRGYVQEIRIPWDQVWKEVPEIAAGLTFTFTGEYFWGGADAIRWPYVMWSDPMNLDRPIRINVYKDPGVWGKMTLLAEGNLPPAPADEDEDDRKLQGPVAIRLSLPGDATRFSVAIDNADGVRVRNLLGNADVEDYLVATEDGRRIVEVLWDGRMDGHWDKELRLFLGEVAPAGEYTVHAIADSGVGVVHAGSFYNPGTPPWPTAEGSGAWLSDHAGPMMVAVMKPGSTKTGQVFQIAHITETGTAFIGQNAEGRKLWQWGRNSSALDAVTGGDTEGYFAFQYVGKSFLGTFDPDTGEQLAFETGIQDVPAPEGIHGLAYADGTLAATRKEQNEVIFFDAATAETGPTTTVEHPSHPAFLPDGTLVGISGDRVFHLANPGAAVQYVDMQAAAKPTALATDSAGRLYIADGADCTIKVFDALDADAEPLAVLGEPGGRQPGPWQPERMAKVVSLAVQEPDGKQPVVWAVESSYRPRRVSVWGMDGALVKDYIGNTNYMGSGGSMSDDIPTLGLFQGVFMDVDYENHDYKVVEVAAGSPPSTPPAGEAAVFGLGTGFYGFENGYHFVSNASGEPVQYYVEGGVPKVFVRRQLPDGRKLWICVAAMGQQQGWQFPEGFPAKPAENAVFVWNDLDGDGYQSPDEIQWRDFEGKRPFLWKDWGYRCYKDLTWYHSGLAFAPVRFADDGAPIYDLQQVETLPGDLAYLDRDIFKTEFGYVAHGPARPELGPDPHGTAHGLLELAGYDENGIRRWTYPAYWHSVHGAMTAPMAQPGTIMGMLKFTGIIEPAQGKSRSFISIRGNIGQEFLVRDDGMYVGELFTDQRMAPASLPSDEDIVGLPINDTTVGGEPFNGWAARQDDGVVRLTYGYTDVRIAKITGLDTIRDVEPVTFEMTEDLVAMAESFEHERPGAKKITRYTIARGAALPADESAFQDGESLSIKAGREELAKATMRYDEKNLYLTMMVYDTTGLVNRGDDPLLAFVTGDSVSLFIARPGEYAPGRLEGARVLLADQEGENVAVLYRPAGEATDPYTFFSPVRSRDFACVTRLPQVTFNAQVKPKRYFVSAAIPWDVLGITPTEGMELPGDVGVTFGTATGDDTDQRVQWVDTQTNVVNDVPTESEFFPARWGTFVLE